MQSDCHFFNKNDLSLQGVIQWRKREINTLIGRMTQVENRPLQRAVFVVALLLRASSIRLVSLFTSKRGNAACFYRAYKALLQASYATRLFLKPSIKEGVLCSYLRSIGVKQTESAFSRLLSYYQDALHKGELPLEDRWSFLQVLSHEWAHSGYLPFFDESQSRGSLRIWVELETLWQQCQEEKYDRLDHQRFWYDCTLETGSLWKKHLQQHEEKNALSIEKIEVKTKRKERIAVLLALQLAALYPLVLEHRESIRCESAYPCSFLKDQPLLNNISSLLEAYQQVQPSVKEHVQEVQQDLCLLKDLYTPFPDELCQQLIGTIADFLESGDITKLIHFLHCLLSSPSK